MNASQPNWWKSAVVYQVYPRSFMDSNGDGIGDIPGIIAKLDYLQRLGIDILWVSPFYTSPMKDNGYDISDYTGVDPLFGTLADVDALIEGLHARGMKLMIDLVLNHTSDQHPWFEQARSSKDNPKRDWYHFQPAREGFTPGQPGAEPTNWLSFFSQPAWTHDPQTDEYYLNLFTREQPDLNWENPAVRQEIYRMLRWWLDRGVDGFRMDVINLVSKRFPLTDGEPIPGTRFGNGWPSFVCGPRIHEFMAEFNREVVAGHDLVTVGETPGVTTEHARRFSDPANQELDMVFQFEHMSVDHGPGGRYDPKPFSMKAMKDVLGRWQTELAEVGWNSLYWDNHDQPRAVSRFGDDSEVYRELSAKALGTILQLQRGTPFIYQGEELGMTNTALESIEAYDDVETRNMAVFQRELGRSEDAILAAAHAQSRDNARTPMQWDDTVNAGFTTGTPWLPVNPNFEEINAQLQVDDPHSVFNHYRALVDLRHSLPVVANGDFTMLVPDDETVFAFTRSLDGVRLLVVANCSTESTTVDLGTEFDSAEMVLGNYADGAGSRAVGSLRPWEARVYLVR